jgi:hypothetical protein
VLFLLLILRARLLAAPVSCSLWKKRSGRVTRRALTMRKKKQAFGLQGLHIKYRKQFYNDQTVGEA